MLICADWSIPLPLHPHQVIHKIGKYKNRRNRKQLKTIFSFAFYLVIWAWSAFNVLTKRLTGRGRLVRYHVVLAPFSQVMKHWGASPIGGTNLSEIKGYYRLHHSILKKIADNKRRHSSRMCTAHFCGFGDTLPLGYPTPEYPTPRYTTRTLYTWYHTPGYPTPHTLPPETRDNLPPERTWHQWNLNSPIPPVNRLTDAYENITFPLLL